MSAWGLREEPVKSYSVEEIAGLLKEYGPLLAASAEAGHPVRVITGMSGGMTPDEAIIHINDPVGAEDPSSDEVPWYTESYSEFVERQCSLPDSSGGSSNMYIAHL